MVLAYRLYGIAKKLIVSKNNIKYVVNKSYKTNLYKNGTVWLKVPQEGNFIYHLKGISVLKAT